jgi:nucleotide-binding universal stress UspA family protein
MTPTIRRILCPVDFSEASTKALEYAGRLATSAGAELILLHAFDIPASLTYADIGNPSDPTVRAQLDSLPVSPDDTTVSRVLHAGPPGEVAC